jgi:pilus assembly protein CpaE
VIRLILTEQAPGAAEGIRAVLSSRTDVQVVGYPRDGLEAAQMASRLQPDVALIHDRLPEMPGTLACELIALSSPRVASVLMCDRNDMATLKRAMRSGARAIISPLTTGEELAATLTDVAEVAGRTAEREYGLVTDPDAMPQTVAFASARDGVGKSTLVVNLAALLGQQMPDRVVLVDLCGQFGSAALLLNIKPGHTILDLASFGPDMDTELVDTFMERHSSGLRILAGGLRPDAAWTDAISVSFVASLLGLLRRRYSLILCDIPALIWPGSLYTISRSQMTLVMANLSDITGVREATAMLEMLSPHYAPEDRLRLVINRVAAHESYSEETVKAATGRPIAYSLPNDAAAIHAAANEGAPVVLAKPQSSYSRAVQAMAGKLMQQLRGAAG